MTPIPNNPTVILAIGQDGVVVATANNIADNVKLTVVRTWEAFHQEQKTFPFVDLHPDYPTKPLPVT